MITPSCGASPTAGSIIVLDRDHRYGEWVLLDNPSAINRCWHRGSREECALFRAIYDACAWGRSPIYIAPIDAATGMPHGVEVDVLGLAVSVVPVVAAPSWAFIGTVVGGQVPAGVLRAAQRRAVPFAADSLTSKSMVGGDQALIKRLESAMHYVAEKCLRQ
jgi:hypothetical protein